MSHHPEFEEEEAIEGEFVEENQRQENKRQENPRSKLDEEILAGEWENLTKNETYKGRSRSGKIIAMHQAITYRIKELEKLFYPLVRDHPEKAQKLLDEIKKLRALREFLMQAYVWEQSGTLTEDDIPEELEGLL